MDCSSEAFEGQPRRPAKLSEEFVPLDASTVYDFGTDQSVRPGLLCSMCKPIASWLELNSNRHGQTKVVGFNHRSTGIELERQFLKGCHLCTLIWQSLVEKGGSSNPKVRFRLRKARITQVRSGTNCRITVRRARNNCFRMITKFETSRRGLFSDKIDINPWPALSQLKATHPQPRLPLSSAVISTASQSTLELGLRWLEECVATHANCQITGKPRLYYPECFLILTPPTQATE